MIRDVIYQIEAVRELCEKTNRLLELDGSKTIVFKAPTGSGKTVMMAKYLKQLVEHREDRRSIAFLWNAPRQLHLQSKEKLEQYFSDSKALHCLLFEDLINRQIGDKEILFLNWESINKKGNIYIRENELDKNLSVILQNTQDAGRTIILVIDESHFASKTEISQDLIRMFKPKVTIEVSATPNIQGDESVTVYRENVIKEEMIKKRVIINPGFRNKILKQTEGALFISSKGEDGTDEFVLRMAIEKRTELAKAFKDIGVNVNPLLLIQLPDRHPGEADFRDEVVNILEENHKINIKNGRLAIYLSEDKKNLENITRNDSEVEVMIFKQAIALGWDCPRASILALFRDWKSLQFSTQTVGRILRMPELKYYDNDEMNIGFVFTSLEDLSIIEDIAGSYLTFQYAGRKKAYKPIHLLSVYPKRFREETRLSPQFIRDFLTAADDLKLKIKINTKVDYVTIEMLSDGLVTDLDSHPDHIAELGDHVQREQNAVEIQKLFDIFIRRSLKPEFFPEMRSVGRVKDAIHYFFKVNFPFEFTGATTRAQIITIRPENRQYFIDTINRAKEIYVENVGKQKRELNTIEKWDIPPSHYYNNRFVEVKYNKSIMQPFFEFKEAKKPEKDFAEFLNNTLANVDWFFKNGETESKFFAVSYKEKDGELKTFFIDWIVNYKDGKIGLFDTKEGFTAEIAKSRAEGLAAYIKEENKKGKKLFGGIVVPKDGSWRLNDNDVYEYKPNDLSKWKILS
jgi:type III restriction enzyme